MGPEAKFYQQIKRNLKEFSFIRIENSSLLGTPDLLVYNTSGYFRTIEIKVTKGNKIRFSPHQIAFHIKHPHNTFIMVKALGPCTSKTSPISMYHGSRIEELVTSGLKLEACYSDWDACRLAIERVGSKAWSLVLEACSLLLLGAWDLRPGPGRTLVPDVSALELMAWSELLRSLRNSL